MKKQPLLAVVQFCAEEVERQQRGPIQVYWMVEAWLWAVEQFQNRPLDPQLIQYLGHLVERHANLKNRWRSVGVQVGGRICPRPEEVPERMHRWLELIGRLTPAEAYLEFEMIHPFRDGNGRVGKILFNWLNGTLLTPEMPPNFFGCANP